MGLLRTIDDLARRAARTTYTTAALHMRLQTRRRLRSIGLGDDKPILVYQMGKVGSTSVSRALRERLPASRVLHIHSLDRGSLGEIASRERRAYRRTRSVSRHWAEGLFVRRIIDDRRRWPWNVVTLVRDPVARNVSAFFQTLAVREPELLLDVELQSRSPDAVAADLARIFLDRFDHDWPLEWFDAEIGAFLSIDLFAQPFPTERGWEIYQNPQARVLLLRLEDLDGAAPEALQSFLGLEPSALARGNVGRAKAYADVYRAFCARPLPESYVDRLYRSKVARHFYTADERERLRARWRCEAGKRPALTASPAAA